ncbi:MAG: hypothetical protein KF780_08285 [Sphingomonas sp.]|nr:hypothetical protein [Sphingomonas sp.]
MIVAHVIGALALAMQPVSPMAGLDCAREVVSPAEREAMADALLNRAPSPFPEEMGLRLRACGERAGHDAGTGRAFMMVAFTALAGEALRGRLAARNIDPAIVDAWYARQNGTTRIEYPDEAAAERMLLELQAAGVPMAALDEHGTMLGNYLATLIIPERVARGLPPQ